MRGSLIPPDDAYSPEDPHAADRFEMVELIKDMAHDAANYYSESLSKEVLTVMAKVPRHRFVPLGETCAAYANRPLPIGHGQTISQPYIVALMTDLLGVDKRHNVLEVGTGSGYQAAVLSEMAGRVYSVEIIASLAAQAAVLLHELGYTNVHVRAGDGSAGWPEYAPYDGIIVTAAAAHIPQPLLDQLKPGGRMVIPVGGWLEVQQLLLITKDSEGGLNRRSIEPVRFVPLTGKHG